MTRLVRQAYYIGPSGSEDPVIILPKATWACGSWDLDLQWEVKDPTYDSSLAIKAVLFSNLDTNFCMYNPLVRTLEKKKS